MSIPVRRAIRLGHPTIHRGRLTTLPDRLAMDLKATVSRSQSPPQLACS
jgi:hypothetical protein